MRRYRGALAGLVLAVVCAAPASAAAVQTTHLSGEQVLVNTDTNVCGFPVTITQDQHYTQEAVWTSNGIPILWNVHEVEVDTAEANGKTVTSAPFHNAVTIRFDSDGNVTSWIYQGVLARFVLPDAAVLRAAGRMGYMPADIFVGHYPDITPFCAALS